MVVFKSLNLKEPSVNPDIGSRAGKKSKARRRKWSNASAGD
jgi:hypothetical protein